MVWRTSMGIKTLAEVAEQEEGEEEVVVVVVVVVKGAAAQANQHRVRGGDRRRN